MATLLLLIIYLTFISLGLPDSLLGAAWPVMRHDLGAPIGMAGVLSFTVTIGTIVSALATSRVVRRIGTARTTLISVAMTAGALLGFSIAPSIAWLMVFAIPLGLGGGAVDSALNHYIAGHYEARHMSWLHCFWGVGVTVSPMILSVYLSEGAWRDGYAMIGFIQSAIAAVLIASLPLWKHMEKKRAGGGRAPQADAPARGPDEGRKPKNAAGVKYALGTFLFYCGVEATAGLWGSSYLVNVKGISADDAALWISIYFMGITIGRFVNGFVTLKFSSLTLIRAGQITTLAGALLLLLPLPAGFSLAGFLITGLGLAPIFPSMLHETPVRFGEAHAGRIMGYQFATAYTGAALLPPLLGMLAGYWTIGIFPLYIVLMAAAMLLATERLNLLLRRRHDAV
ncbi:MAG: MFS transporter [Thermobacillus sp.]|jgi:fucose permease|uniref:Fucose permease n=2 Tax=Thermobacillus TaxID=76632 RepID=L0EAX7_THECK|nr:MULTISPECIES: MFS transporter [Thermobacillus]AGA56310.1 fucose permease [Thermobacillus composti KWC4]REK58816.1 MAG: MFS transporter [Thermobacillus sp.]CAG5076198.1 Bypass of stop codon protein 6,Major facilitator superfamily transporter MFS_1 [Thermobacillus xylanilyticus]